MVCVSLNSQWEHTLPDESLDKLIERRVAPSGLSRMLLSLFILKTYAPENEEARETMDLALEFCVVSLLQRPEELTLDLEYMRCYSCFRFAWPLFCVLLVT
jgi:hypothetical protein